MSDVTSNFPFGEQQQRQIAARQRRGNIWAMVFRSSTLIAMIALSALLYNIINSSFGLVAIQNQVNPAELIVEGIPIDRQAPAQLITILTNKLSKGLVRRYNSETPLTERPKEDLLNLVYERVVRPKVIESWDLSDSLLRGPEIRAEWRERDPDAILQMRAWVNMKFLTSSQSSVPENAGIRTAILGSLMTILVTIMFSFPIGVGAAVYLEEYARDTLFSRLVKTNISNLAGVPSIIYGMLGLAIFVRFMEPITSGAFFGFSDPTTANGRTVLSAGLTLGLLILPVIIINSQEAIKAVPGSLREASFGVGATRWQTVWSHVLPSAMPGILTGAILSISRAIGETAPLVVIGASTFIAVDPSSAFSKFTTLPVQVYQWASRPQPEFRHIAAAAIVVLMVLLLSMNAFAIILRNRYRSKMT